jgi:hypothetical protein
VGLFTRAPRLAVHEAQAYRLRLQIKDGVQRQYVGDPRECPVKVVDLRAEADARAAAVRWMRAVYRPITGIT